MATSPAACCIRTVERSFEAGSTCEPWSVIPWSGQWVGAAGDNAAMESIFSLLQKNVLDRQVWATREELRIAIVTWIQRTYHRRRRQATLDQLTPSEFETIMTTPATQAA